MTNRKSVAFTDETPEIIDQIQMPSTPATQALDESTDLDAQISLDLLNNNTTSSEYILYFIRHGEALHNIREKNACAAALAAALAQGHDADSDHVASVVEEARKAALNDAEMEDPPLSELGMEEARCAKRNLERLIKQFDLPEVEEVWVSPLQRALKTASIIFPCADNENDETKNRTPRIRVREELEERHTGFACDTAIPQRSVKRNTFQRFSFSGLKPSSMEEMLKRVSNSSSMDKMNRLDEDQVDAGGPEEDFGLFRLSGHPGENLWEQLESVGILPDEEIERDNSILVTGGIDEHSGCLAESDGSLNSYGETTNIEDKAMLRERTKKLFDLLAETDSRSICLVGHKGYLRELERGPLGYEDAVNFQNCELRVYRLVLDVINDDMPDRRESTSSIVAERITAINTDE